jgi:hypothetical protein
MKIIVAAAADRPAAHRRRRADTPTNTRIPDTRPRRADISRHPDVPAVMRAKP